MYDVKVVAKCTSYNTGVYALPGTYMYACCLRACIYIYTFSTKICSNPLEICFDDTVADLMIFDMMYLENLIIKDFKASV